MKKVFKEAAETVVTGQVAEAIMRSMAREAIKNGNVRAAKLLLHVRDGRPETWVNQRIEIDDSQRQRLESIFGIDSKAETSQPEPEPETNGNGHADFYRS